MFNTKPLIRLYACFFVLMLLVPAARAGAQYKPRPLNDPATGETYHVEASVAYWFPSADISVASEQLGIAGTTIDFKNDLGLTDQRFPEIHLVLRPSSRHKFRFQYIPISYAQSAQINRTIIFNGQRYSVGLPVNSSLDWKAYRFGYEYDFVVTNRGFGGFIVEAKYTDVTVRLASPIVNEFARARAPIPAIGGIVRIYAVPNISITGEVTGFKLPDNIDKRYRGHYADIDIYGTLNFTDNIGAQVGYRSLDVGYLVKSDTGSFTLRGLYVGAVARF